MDLLQLQADPARFQEEICLATGSGPRRFGDIMQPFQRERFAAVNASLLAVARHEAPPVPRIWDERTKGASKDTDWAVNLLWLLAFSPRPLRMQVGAFDAEQADEVRLIVKDVLRADGPVNAFLRQVIEAQADRIINARTGGVIEILTSDQWGSHGSRIDLLLMSELTHQPSSGFAETLFDNLDKMPLGLGVVITNSGHDPSWQLEWKQVFRAMPDRWLVLEFNEPAPWVSAASLAEAEKRNPLGRYLRLWRGVWTAEEGAPALEPADIAAAFDPALRPLMGAEAGYETVAGLDLGIARNWSSLAILGVKRRHADHARIRLVDLRVWKPRPGRRVDLQEVEDALIDARYKFGLRALVFDPWQCAHLASRVQASNAGRMVRGWREPVAFRLVEAAPTKSMLQKIATATREAFADRRIALFEDAALRRDLKLLQLVERPDQSFRLVSPVTSDGSHGDAATSLCLALMAATELAALKRIVVGSGNSDPDYDPDEGPLQRSQRRQRKLRERELKASNRRRQQIAAMPDDRTLGMMKAFAKKFGVKDTMSRMSF
ncbi:MAG: hypothetical protein L0Y72_06525 [Gemmataceae bacterium]|nr:hypothetical protein [Gemmataceae bacterium]MCI0738681.1 hypothetical protein [Gemmataceae bacterium]